MILSLLVQLFFSLHQEPMVSTVPEVQAAPTTSHIEIKGVDQTTSRSYNHTLPVANTAAFGPQRKESASLGVLTSADSALVLDKRTSSELYEKASDEVRSIASITKLMTVLTLSDLDLDMQQVVTISKADYILGGKIHYYIGEQFLMQDLWLGGLIASDNVAISAMVRNSGLTFDEFILAMNAKAKSLDMLDTTFVEPTGINALNKSTAQDVAKLVLAATEVKDITDGLRRPNYTFTPLNKESYRTVTNTNILVNSYLNEDPYEILGGKTGFTFEAGYCLAVIVKGPEAKEDLVVVVLGADTIDARFQEVKGLIDWTYEHYQW